MTARPPKPPFPLGRIVMTANARDQLPSEDILTALERHTLGDWGNVCDEDRQENELALIQRGQLFSAYEDRTGKTFWIITEADRSATTILLPKDY